MQGTWGKNREHAFYFAALVLVISAIKMVFHVHFLLKQEGKEPFFFRHDSIKDKSMKSKGR
ncbi:hypothetical protein BH747_09495 [Enterococcus villorum]|uniref:Uncharacterized protein n=1 Tax=Enterococcus villorum TaxID=112904 RepID=A0A1V8YB00_9ENTE|nr:hypothetical protein BH747_09495 [Enterococcus villorum]OQO74943.1 hypothetical protein BH744_06625 [Enterococcus villorum]